jgi:MraZ protein
VEPSGAAAVLRGSQQAKIDEKGRLKLPTSFRSYIDATWKTASVYLTCDDSAGTYVRVYPLPVWESIEQKLLTMPSSDLARRRFHRWTAMYGQEGEIDAQGRVLIPPQLRDTALMQGDVVVLGSGDFLEVWNRERFISQADSEKLTASDHDRLSEFGI